MDLRGHFQTVKAEELHYVYGANCFQHAIGYPTPIFSRTQAAKRDIVNYVRLLPGSVFTDDGPTFVTPLQYRNKILERCRDEGMIFSGNRCVTREGFRTIAFFLGEPMAVFDFHFAFLNGRGLWETKIQFNEPFEFNSVREAGLGIYHFDAYLLIPQDAMPKAISEWCAKPVEVTSASGQVVKLLEVGHDSPGLCATPISFNAAINTCTHIGHNATFPLPPWPPKASSTITSQYDSHAKPT